LQSLSPERARASLSPGVASKEGKKLEKELRELGAEVEFVKTDVRHDDDIRALIDKTVARFGRLNIAVNNAGTEGLRGLVTEQTAESYAATFDTNVLGVLLSMKHELRVMLPQGSVIAVGTTDTGMLTRFTNTDENKAALVSTVPLKRLATPEEIAHVIAFVGSANASYMTGSSIPVDGGKLAH
jgi:NAD(P)-dependent dehydrogenase (short-subunit alcohol dehydrogenase family)